MATETKLKLVDGRTLRIYDTGPSDSAQLPVYWFHSWGTTGAPPEPLLRAARERGIRWVSHDRPGYGGSSPRPGRNIGSIATDVAAVADFLGLHRFAVMGHSGGSPHALACAAVLPDRVQAAVCMSGLAPLDAAGLDWFEGMVASGAAELRAATTGHAELVAYLATSEFDPRAFTPADEAALSGVWSWMGTVGAEAANSDHGGMVDDDLAYVAPWGCDLGSVRAPTLFVYGTQDRINPAAHGSWLARRCHGSQLWLRSGQGHISILNSSVQALDWVRHSKAQNPKADPRDWPS